MTEAYCVKCRAKREMLDPKAVVLANGRKATKGTCKTCKTRLCRIG